MFLDILLDLQFAIAESASYPQSNKSIVNFSTFVLFIILSKGQYWNVK